VNSNAGKAYFRALWVSTPLDSAAPIADNVYVLKMKKEIHPKYYEKATVKCSCGAVHTIGSSREKMTVEICSECHPFYTGKEKLVDTAGRVEKFKSRQEKAKASATAKKASAKSESARGGKTDNKKTAEKKKDPARKAEIKTKKAAKKPAKPAAKKIPKKAPAKKK